MYNQKRKEKGYMIILSLSWPMPVHLSKIEQKTRITAWGHCFSLRLFIISCKARLLAMSSLRLCGLHTLFGRYTFKGQFCWWWAFLPSCLLPCGLGVSENVTSGPYWSSTGCNGCFPPGPFKIFSFVFQSSDWSHMSGHKPLCVI